ncbi:MAG: hypothetical protein KatS3mg035_1045 [Bacteroidia bacterium]|nr:MAG: hypothetical protein KatS3mg035_1045 [Bacteroidia bacterium]
MILEIRTKEGDAVADLKGNIALKFYKYLSEDAVNFTKAVKTFGSNSRERKQYNVFAVTSDMKINITDEVVIWLFAGSYVKILL